MCGSMSRNRAHRRSRACRCVPKSRVRRFIGMHHTYHIQVWDGISDSRIHFSNSDIRSSTYEMARLTENLNLQRALLRRLDQIPGRVQLMDQVKVESISRGEGWPVVNVSDGPSLRTRLLVRLSWGTPACCPMLSPYDMIDRR